VFFVSNDPTLNETNFMIPSTSDLQEETNTRMFHSF